MLLLLLFHVKSDSFFLMSEFIHSDREFTSSNEHNNVHDEHGENKLKTRSRFCVRCCYYFMGLYLPHIVAGSTSLWYNSKYRWLCWLDVLNIWRITKKITQVCEIRELNIYLLDYHFLLVAREREAARNEIKFVPDRRIASHHNHQFHKIR